MEPTTMTTTELLFFTLITIIVALLSATLCFIALRRAFQPIPAPDDEDENPVVLVRTRAPIAPEDAQKAISTWLPTDPTRQVVEDAFDLFLADAVAAAASPKATADERAYAAGALDAMQRFKSFLFSIGEPEQGARK